MTPVEFLTIMMNVLAPGGSEIKENNDGRGLFYQVSLKNPEDASRVIGGRGRHVEAVKTLFRVAAFNHGIHAAIKFNLPVREPRMESQPRPTGVLPSV